MGKLKFLLPIILLILLAVWAIPAILKAMPDRYVARLPEPLKNIGLPEDTVAILPTVDSPISAIELLTAEPPAIIPSPTLRIVATITPGSESAQPPMITNDDQEQQTIEADPAKTPTLTPIPTPTPWPIPAKARLNGFQHKFQQWNNCGPATLAMALTYFGVNSSQSDTAAILKPNPEDRNVTPHELVDYVNSQTPYKAITRVNGSPELLKTFINNGIPVIIEIGIEPPGEYRWLGWYGHYLLPVAYDDELEQFWVYDSWFGTSEEPLTNAHPAGRVLSYEELETYWPHFLGSYIILYDLDQSALVNDILGDALEDEKMWQNALETMKSDLALEPDNPFLWFNLGTIYNAKGQYEEAVTAFDQARSLGLPWRMLWYQFGPYEAYYQTGRFDDVILLADVTLKDRPYFEESYYYKGLALAALGNNEDAQNALESSISFNPNFLDAAQALADLQKP